MEICPKSRHEHCLANLIILHNYTLNYALLCLNKYRHQLRGLILFFVRKFSAVCSTFNFFVLFYVLMLQESHF